MRRLGWEGKIRQYLPADVSIPAIGQGALGIEIRSDDERTREAVAFLHQFQRPRKRLPAGVEYIEASVEDYAIAYSLATTALGFGLDELRKPARDLLALVELKVKGLAEERGARPAVATFTRRDVRSWSGLPNHQVKLAMHELEELEYIEVEKAARGSRFVYRLVADARNRHVPLTGLLTPVELMNRSADGATTSATANLRRPPALRPAPRKACPEPSRRVEQSGKRAVSTHF